MAVSEEVKQLKKKAEVPVIVPGQVEAWQQELSQQAEKFLGYTVLSKHLGKIPQQLAKALAKLEIEILPPRAVFDYQCEKGRPSNPLWNLLEIDDDDEDISFDEDFEWVRGSLRGYNKPVPEFVLHKAIQIKRAVPNVSLHIEFLASQPKPDPFLVATLNNETFYVEVWDEPKFEGRMVVENSREKSTSQV